MQNKRLWLPMVIAGVAACATQGATAAGLAAGPAVAVLGQPLDFIAPVRLDPGESIPPECVAAEVTVGDRTLPAGVVRVALEPAAADGVRIRVRTAVGIDEPVVAVLVHAGCGSRVSRRYVVMADPPGLPAPQAGSPAPAHAAAPPDVATVAPAGATEPVDRSVAAVPALAARPVALREGRASATARRATATAPRPQRRPAAARRAAGGAEARLRPSAMPLAPVAAAAGRLKLEVAEPARTTPDPVVDQAFDAVAQAASAVRAAASAASAASERIAGLERTVDTLRQEARASRDMAVQMRDRLASQEDQGRWLWPLLGAVLVLVGLSGWLAWRLAAVQRVRQDDWQRAVRQPRAVEEEASVPPAEVVAGKQPTEPVPFVASEIIAPVSAPGRQRLAAWPPAAPTAAAEPEPDPPAAPAPAVREEPAREYPYDSAMTRTEPLPPQALPAAAPRDVTIEELIDLEQQAEFFVVLGQDDAAIDLLVEHLRQSGGGSPLPYLKLLEIHHRRGERADYDRMRTRFNHRFNAYAPEWGVDLGAGRTLEDYAGVIPRLQQVWSRPLDAMAELEALLFRKSRGDLFDLPAYREVLFLYSLARDLLDREAATTGNVDLLLPMADGTEFSSTTPAPYLGLEREIRRPARDDFDERPTSPVDLDLSSDLDRPTSIFDPLDPRPERPLRR